MLEKMTLSQLHQQMIKYVASPKEAEIRLKTFYINTLRHEFKYWHEFDDIENFDEYLKSLDQDIKLYYYKNSLPQKMACLMTNYFYTKLGSDKYKVIKMRNHFKNEVKKYRGQNE